MISEFKTKLKSFSLLEFFSPSNLKHVYIYTLTLIILFFLFSGLFDLQILKGRQNLLAATRTSQSVSLVLPPRGLVYDSNGEILAYNAPTYSIYIEKEKLPVEKEREVMKKIADVLDRDPEELLNIYRKDAYETNEARVKVIAGINSDRYFQLVEKLSDLEEVNIENENQRRYKDSEYFSHVIGYVGKPAESELGDGVYTISLVGKSGIEKVYDESLRGKIGKQVIQKQYLEGLETTFEQEKAEDGYNLHLTIDSKWQKKLFDIMSEVLENSEAFASAAVVMDSDTGEVKSMVSLPSYDNNLFVDAIKTNQYEMLLKDEKTPLLNRPIALQLPSGSVFKVVGATAALEEGIINENTVIQSEGCMQLSAGVEFCEADRAVLGNLTVTSALSKSSNLYFCRVAMMLNRDADGINTILKYADQYGLGKKTGIELMGEQVGTLPSPELKKQRFDENWYVGDDCNSIIGQGMLTVTPIQMAVTTSAINNGGKVLRPRLVNKIEDQDQKDIKYVQSEIINEVEVSQKHLDLIKEGMRMAAREGSGSQLSDLPGNVIIKTGSADASELISGQVRTGAHSWVIGCFDKNEKNYCFAMIQQWGGRGYRTVPLIKKFINCVQKDFTPRCQDIN